MASPSAPTQVLVGIFPIDEQGVRFEQVDTAKQFPLGFAVQDNQGGMWKYCSFAAGGALYDTYWIDENFAAVTLLNATTPASLRPVGIGIACAVFTATTYGWLWCGGVSAGGVGSGIKANVLISCVKDVAIYATSTAGKLDDASTSNYRLINLCTTATEPGTGTAAIEVFSTGYLALGA